MQGFAVRDTDGRRTSEVNDICAKVYSTNEAVKVEFIGREVKCGAWLTPTQAAELIELLRDVFVEESQ